jgi:hypothetical protein
MEISYTAGQNWKCGEPITEADCRARNDKFQQITIQSIMRLEEGLDKMDEIR